MSTVAFSALAAVAAACGGTAPASRSLPLSARLPGASTLCPPASEVDYYVPLPSAAKPASRSYLEAHSPALSCQYGEEVARAARTWVVITYELDPPASSQHPVDVVVHRLRNVGDWAISFRRKHLTYVVVDEGSVDVTVTADADAIDLLGLAEEELARVPVGERS